MADDMIFLESALKRRAYEESPLRILEAESAAAVGKNENYFSCMTKMNVTVLLGSGKTRKMTVMVKNNHTGDFMRILNMELGVFVREITMYRDILPKMADLMEECGDTDDPMWAKCYDVRLYDRLVLEDLTASGYKMANRIEQLSLDSCLLVVKNIAKFHGLSHVLLKRFEIPLEIYGRYNYENIPERYNEQMISDCTKLLKTIDTWGNDWRDVRQRFEKAIPKLTGRLLEATEPVCDDFVVLNHGDCWTNNFLFRNAPDSDTPITMKFVDFQLCFTGPVSYDLDFLFATSVTPEIYRQHWDLIIRTYCDALKRTMEKLNYEGPVPDYDAIVQLMKRTHIIYLARAVAIIPVILGESKDIPDLGVAIMKEREARAKGEEGTTWNIHEGLKGPPKTVIQFVLRDAVDNGLI